MSYYQQRIRETAAKAGYITIDHLAEALEGAQFAADDLKRALGKATALEAVIIIPMIGEAHALIDKMKSLIEAEGAMQIEARRPWCGKVEP